MSSPEKPSRMDIEAAVQTLIRAAGDNPDREGLVDTPARVARAYRDWFSGYPLTVVFRQSVTHVVLPAPAADRDSPGLCQLGQPTSCCKSALVESARQRFRFRSSIPTSLK
jgi:hypothetical protein